MSKHEKILLYSLANTFHTLLKLDICEATREYIKTKLKTFSNLIVADKMYYSQYALKLASSLMDYLSDVIIFELNTDDAHEINHDFRLIWGKKYISHINISHKNILVRDIIPEKLMKICKYKKNTKICKSYQKHYKKISTRGYKKIKTMEKYSEIPAKLKNSAIIVPVCELVVQSLSKKRKCAQNLYNHLMGENERLVLKLYKNRFVLYDFSSNSHTVESFKMKLTSPSDILLTFNNNAQFSLSLHTNASKVKEHLSLKFRTKFKNIDELFAVMSTTI